MKIRKKSKIYYIPNREYYAKFKNHKLIYKFIIILASIFILYILYCIKSNLYLYNNKFEKEVILKERLDISISMVNIYSELFDFIKNKYLTPKYSDSINYYSLKPNIKNTCICTIGKNENLHIREYVEYYFNLGVGKIFIYDNNDIEGEKFESKIADYIKNKFVEIIDIRGLSAMQIPIFNYCYRKYRNKYNWIAFLDIDEYLYIENNKSINDFLNEDRFNKCQSIFINWVMYNDNDLIRYDNRKLKDRFTNKVSQSSEGKSFVRGNIDDLLIPTTHIVGINIKNFCNANGELIYPKNFMNNRFPNNPKAYIKHYYTKTAEEFCNKITKGNAHFHKNHPEYIGTIKFRINYFFNLNKKTEEKLSILEKCSNTKLKR